MKIADPGISRACEADTPMRFGSTRSIHQTRLIGCRQTGPNDFGRVPHHDVEDGKIRHEDASAFRRQAARLREFCVRLTELRHRPLFYALSRRAWELREELDLLDRYVEFESGGGSADAACRSDFHLPGTYRGGMVARLQRLLDQRPDGAFAPARHGQDNC